MNKIVLMGRLTADPEMRQTSNGIAVCSFSVAVNRRFAKEGQQNVDFINCSAWRQQAEFICKYFQKGSMIAVVGSIQTRTWENQEGKKQYSTDVLVDEVYFTGSKAEQHTVDPPDTVAENAQNLGFTDDFGNVEGLPF